jgi:hypothetical protein
MTISIRFDQRDDQSNKSVDEEDSMRQPVETRQDGAVVIVGMDLVTLRDETTSSSMTEHVFDDGSTSNKFDEDSLVLTQRRRLRDIYDAEEDSLVLARRRGLGNRGATGGPLDTSHNEEAEPDYGMQPKSITPEKRGGLSNKPQILHVRHSSEPLLRCVSRRSRMTSGSRLIRRCTSTARHRLQRINFPRLYTTDEIRR